MANESQPYKWAQYKDGFMGVAIVTLTVTPNTEQKNVIIENYSGNGFVGQGYTEIISATGYTKWKQGAKLGLGYAFSLINSFWHVRIDEIEASDTDTNATIIGYTVLRAFLHQINFTLPDSEIEELEAFVRDSWSGPRPYVELIPDFFDRSYSY